MTTRNTRNLIGYSNRVPVVEWPGRARLALNFVLNYEEGAEMSVADGDPVSEVYLSELVGLAPLAARRNLLVESIYQYGSRAGVWRLLRIFAERNASMTIYAVGLALQRNPEAARAFVEAGHEIASHCWRWIDYSTMPEEEEREHIRLAVAGIRDLTGQPPFGWYTGRFSPNTRRLVLEEAQVLYDSDAYDDDLPYWVTVAGRPHLVIPYTLDCNDGKYSMSPGWMSGEDFLSYLRSTFDFLYREGERSPKMMSVGLHCRLSGRPGRADVVARFLDYALGHEDVWICQRVDIARHWIARHPPSG